MMSTFLITGATGRQGNAVAHQLLAASKTVCAYTRDANSRASKALAAAGAEIFEGSFDDKETLLRACGGCDGVFANVNPNFVTPSIELDHASNIFAAAKARGVRHVIYTSVCKLDEPGKTNFDEIGPGAIAFLKTKLAIEEKLKDTGFERWTILRPSTFMTNFLHPMSSRQYPELGKEGVLLTGLRSDVKLSLIDVNDIGKFAEAAFLDPDRFHGQHIDLGWNQLTIAELAAVMQEVSGKRVEAKFYTEDQLKAMDVEKPAMRPLKEGWKLLNTYDLSVDRHEVEAWGISMGNFKDFLIENKEALRQSIGSP